MKKKISFFFYVLSIISFLISALVYLFRPEFMPYHTAAIGKSWTEIHPHSQTLILALMRVAGSSWLATSLAMGILLFIPFLQDKTWARWALPVIGLSSAIPTFYATLFVKFNTPASPPWFSPAS